MKPFLDAAKQGLAGSSGASRLSQVRLASSSTRVPSGSAFSMMASAALASIEVVSLVLSPGITLGSMAIRTLASYIMRSFSRENDADHEMHDSTDGEQQMDQASNDFNSSNNGAPRSSSRSLSNEDISSPSEPIHITSEQTSSVSRDPPNEDTSSQNTLRFVPIPPSATYRNLQHGNQNSSTEGLPGVFIEINRGGTYGQIRRISRANLVEANHVPPLSTYRGTRFEYLMSNGGRNLPAVATEYRHHRYAGTTGSSQQSTSMRRQMNEMMCDPELVEFAIQQAIEADYGIFDSFQRYERGLREMIDTHFMIGTISERGRQNLHQWLSRKIDEENTQ